MNELFVDTLNIRQENDLQKIQTYVGVVFTH